MTGLLEEPMILADGGDTGGGDPPPTPPDPPPVRLPNDTAPPDPQQFSVLDVGRLNDAIPAMRDALASINRAKRVSSETLNARITI